MEQASYAAGILLVLAARRRVLLRAEFAVNDVVNKTTERKRWHMKPLALPLGDAQRANRLRPSAVRNRPTSCGPPNDNDLPSECYSCRSASTGLTRDALRAGSALAMSPSVMERAAAVTYTNGSRRVTPNKRRYLSVRNTSSIVRANARQLANSSPNACCPATVNV